MHYDILDVDLNSVLSVTLSDFAKHCSFQGTGAYFAELIDEKAFEDYEKAFAVISDEKIIGFGAFLKECLCLQEDKSPWLDFLFVDEKYRNFGIGKALVEKICECAKIAGFDNIYLCTVTHADYYKCAGFNTLYSTDYFNNMLNDRPIHIMKREFK